ncbi:hypothetical protein [Endozoicomonas ascidiicola]|uniref:hypothetical protein n=1 Tax=Endozoicomonas ascidiicola TaxID=1698521 RepID=UPI000A9847BC|nr:hypothetical protein [Endozoicomonas ascidiicola]
MEELLGERGSSAVYSELSAKLGDLQLMATVFEKQAGYDRKLDDLKKRYKKKVSIGRP